MKPLKELLETHTLREGDHFHWQYDDSVEKCEFTYWCKSCMCVWDGEQFKDLFWSMGQGSNSYTLDENTVLLSFMGNINDYRECYEDDFKYYDDSDILNRSHPNHSGNWGKCFYIKKDAERSREKMKQHVQAKIEAAEYKIRSAQQEHMRALHELDNLNNPDYDVNQMWI